MFVPVASRERVQLGCPYIILEDECGRTLPPTTLRASEETMRRTTLNYVLVYKTLENGLPFNQKGDQEKVMGQ